ncbi:apolipoprotein B receptor [Fukomys damarensis]|uniref:Apolipoprotein B receptor n=1 Tax=Fukomys damarensis TaxID=885580 RepID=A0A091EDV8_FUKDA|nr:apolipoprotein B receptor [Fukomys damarensis]KFO33556.1 Apolipoprotein B receptor [Fukomys damarensis]
MDFLRQHLPGLHQALRGALDSLSTFVSYLMGDAVPTVEREVQAAEELGEVAAGKSEKNEAQEALQSLRDGQSEGVGALRGPGEAGGCQEQSSAAEWVWGWGEGSSCRSQAGRQDSGAWGSVTAARGPEPTALLKAEETSEAGSGTHRDRVSQTKERPESEEQEVNKADTLTTWEQEEEEEEEGEVRARAPGMARRVESDQPWHGEPKGKAGAKREKVARDRVESRPVVREAVAETEASGATEPQREEGEVAGVRAGQSTRVQGTQGPGAQSEDWTTSTRAEAHLPGVRETADGLVPGDRCPEASSSIRILEEASNRDQEEEPEKRVDKVKVFPKQPWALVSEATEEAAEGQKTRREAAGAQEPEEEAGQRFEGKTDLYRSEAQGRQNSEVRADGASLLEEVPGGQPWEEKGSCRAPESELAPHKEAEGEANSEAALEARPEEEFMWERGQEDQTSQGALGVEWGALRHRVTGDQGPESVGDAQTPAEPPKEVQEVQVAHRQGPALSKEETESEKEQPRHVGSLPPELFEAEDWELWWGRDMESKITQEETAHAEEGDKEAAGGQALEAEAKGGWESELPEIPEWGREKRETSSEENQELQGYQGAEAGTGQALGEPEARETRDRMVDVTEPGEAARIPREGWSLREVALSLQNTEDTQTSPLPAEMEGRQAGGAPRHGRAFEEGEETGVGVGQPEAMLLEETGKWHVSDQRGHGERQCHPEGEVQRPLGVDGAKVTEGQRTEAERAAPEDLEAVQGQEGQPVHQPPVETAEAMGTDGGDTHSSWSEVLLPGSRLDVSVSRSRALLTRNSSKRRSRPSFWRTSASEQQDPPSPQPEEELSTPEQSPLQLEDAPEPSPSQSGGTPEQAGRKLLGHGFGLAHPGMMQELQARLSQRKPQ